MDDHLVFWDNVLFWGHVVITVFNLTGWIWKRTRKLHLIVVSVTFFSWVILGMFYGFGYCFLTDWDWEIKYKLGETGLPASFIKYFFDRYSHFQITAQAVDVGTAVAFAAILIITVYVNFIKKKD